MIFKLWKVRGANDLDAYVPEVWAAESLMILEANMIAGNLVHRDFSPEIAQFGDVVNTRRPNEFEMKRKVDDDDVTIQDASATNVPVALNQHGHVSFLIRDGQESKGFKNLVDEFLRPALLAVANGIDQVLLGQVYRFKAYSAGKLGTTPDKATVIAARTVMNQNKVPLQGRNLIVTASTEGSLLNIADFVNAEKVGDDGTALREGSLGRKFGFNTFMCQNAPSIAAGNTVVTGAVNNAGGYAAGTTTITVDGITGALVTGSWCTIAGDMTPQLITAHTETTGNTTEIVVTPGIKYAVANDAVLTVYTPGAVNLTAGYAIGWSKPLVIDGFTVAPKAGQLTSFGAVANYYAAINTPTTTGILLDRPLVAAAANDAVVGIGPAGEYNFGFHRNALALVSRPLATPRQGTGALSAVANYNGLGVRVTITYNGEKQGHLVTVDLLFGVAVLDSRLGVVLYA